MAISRTGSVGYAHSTDAARQGQEPSYWGTMWRSHRNMQLLPLRPHAFSLPTSTSGDRPVLEKNPGESGRDGWAGSWGALGLMTPAPLVQIYLPVLGHGPQHGTASSVKTGTLEKQAACGLPRPLLNFQGHRQSRGWLRFHCCSLPAALEQRAKASSL